MAKKPVSALESPSSAFSLLSDLDQPVTIVGATPFGCLGLEGYVAQLRFVSALDCTADLCRPVETTERDKLTLFDSASAACNELLKHAEVAAYLKQRGPGLLWPAAATEETASLAKALGQSLALSSPSLLHEIADDVACRSLLQTSGVAFVPLVAAQVDSYAELLAVAQKARLGSRLVLHTGEDERRITGFVENEKDWVSIAALYAGQPIQISRFMAHDSFHVEAVAMPEGVVCGPILRLFHVGQDIGALASSSEAEPSRAAILALVKKAGVALSAAGFKGAFACRIYLESETGKPLVKHVHPGLTVFSQLTQLLTAHYGGMPLHAFHLLAFSDAGIGADLLAVQKRYQEHGTWSQLVLRHHEDSTEFITKSPASSIYAQGDDGTMEIAVPSINPLDIRGPNECLLLRTLGTGTYRHRGLELGLVLGRGNAFVPDRTKTTRAMRWAKGFGNMFNAVQMSGSSLAGAAGSSWASLFG